MDIDKQNGDIAFSEGNHVYWDVNNDNKYISVTTLIERFGQPFDKNFWSAYKALERLIPVDNWKIEKKSLLNTHKFDKEILNLYDIPELEFNKVQQDILDEWDETNKESCERGTKIHSELEHSFYKMGANCNLNRFGIGGKFICDKGRTNLDLENGVYPEYLISRASNDNILRIAGQIDLLVKKENHIIICDWKGLPLDTEILTSKGWSTIGLVQEGDIIYDEDGKETKIIHKSKIHNNPCYKITFDNNDSIVADCDHRWKISFSKGKKEYNDTIMTTKDIFDYMSTYKRNSYTIPKILNPKPIEGVEKNLLIDPYVLGAWLGDGSKDCGIITQAKDSPLWDEIKSRGYEISNNDQHNPDRENVEMRTVYGLRTLLRKEHLLKNKHIPEEYYTASYKQRLDLLRGLMDTDGYYHPKRKRFVMETSQDWQCYDFIKLLASLGIKSTKFNIITKLNGKKYNAYSINFSTNKLNPFLIRNQNIEYPTQDNNSFRNIDKIELVETIPTQCLEVDSLKHTFLCTNKCIVTHNTNKEIKQHSGFDTKTRQTVKMKYPLNNLEDCNYYHYTLQLSTYAWMIQKFNPNFIIDDLILIHFDHNENQTIYHLDYLKDDVEKMLRFYKKECIHNIQQQKYKEIEY